MYRRKIGVTLQNCLCFIALIFMVSGCPKEEGCPEGQEMCAGKCVTLATDPYHCGSCGKSCGPGMACSSGVCGASCQPDMSVCMGKCVDYQTDSLNCGACGHQCESGTRCSSGICGPTCQPHMSLCMGKCVDYQTDSLNCGACGNQCGSGMTCSYGICGVSCPLDLSLCGNKCVNYQTDIHNCGYCGYECGPGLQCASGNCVPTCAEPLKQCGDRCVDITNDPEHCGSCNNKCGSGQICAGLSGCQDLSCPQLCPPDQTLCSGHCVDTMGDVLHCGGCGNACGAEEACMAGVCTAGTFRIVSLDTQCRIVDDTSKLDAPRGPIAFGEGLVFYSGASRVLSYDFADYWAEIMSQEAIPGLTSDLASGKLWALSTNQGWAVAAGATITKIIPVINEMPLVAGTPIPLSESFQIPAGSGIFAGFGHVAVHTGTELIVIDTANGEVTRLASSALQAAPCQGPFYSGIIEMHADGMRLTYVQASTSAIVRTRPGDGATQVVLQGIDFADMCGITVDLSRSRWCFHLAQPSQEFDTQPGQSATYCCDAVFAM
ncbi:MAG TPA: MXAN_6577-like cysteine-rich protein [Polyangiaceae bacterium]|nr:MXAN_6577-like cysteine-rich protein [Polyangiaceae bacterium]HNZ22214.1 MXAN_6577-like cysteine-rich protein [Polyangiaceae bacterium]HOD22271.1 MXAN_6577-like cysteine-rich protein [Polyangiaceae bacterium]HOE47038.1 MXAN_6577-like cysteine-rich protein [Polyangiaceae bacterium]HOG99883.1 MXAN_6577-like cysteine-rich protein [Polyangiaceae bacterium]